MSQPDADRETLALAHAQLVESLARLLTASARCDPEQVEQITNEINVKAYNAEHSAPITHTHQQH